MASQRHPNLSCHRKTHRSTRLLQPCLKQRFHHTRPGLPKRHDCHPKPTSPSTLGCTSATSPPQPGFKSPAAAQSRPRTSPSPSRPSTLGVCRNRAGLGNGYDWFLFTRGRHSFYNKSFHEAQRDHFSDKRRGLLKETILFPFGLFNPSHHERHDLHDVMTRARRYWLPQRHEPYTPTTTRHRHSRSLRLHDFERSLRTQESPKRGMKGKERRWNASLSTTRREAEVGIFTAHSVGPQRRQSCCGWMGLLSSRPSAGTVDSLFCSLWLWKKKMDS